jgi:hypothetical protein
MSVPLSVVQWLVRAEEARLDAAATHNPQARRMMLIMAAGYERLAKHTRSVERSVCRTRWPELASTQRGSWHSSQLVATQDTLQADEDRPLGSAPRAGRPAWNTMREELARDEGLDARTPG